MAPVRPTPGEEEASYDRTRLRQWLAGEARADGMSRRRLLTLLAAASAATALPRLPRAAAATGPGIVKPLPEEWFTVRGTNAETRWEALRGTGYHTPVGRFFVRNHTSTPVIDAATWRLRLWGSGLHGAPGIDRAVEFGLDDLRRLPAVSRDAFVECAGNGRSLYTSQQGQTVSGTAWTLGAVGVARWRGVRLSQVLRRAGLTPDAVDVMPRGLDGEYVADGVNLGHVRRPLPIAKALDDVVLAYEMNGEPLPYDHGHPVRVLVPSWVGISSVKWVGDIEVSAEPLYSPWNTDFYRLFGPGYPDGGAPVTRQTLKSAFELASGATFAAGGSYVLHGRSWSGAGGVRDVQVSTDGGARWQTARRQDAPHRDGWVRWSVPWNPRTPGPAELLARATDTAGRTQPDQAEYNTQGYLFDAVVRHPVTVV
ncbi:sulfite oxidase [Peterkaempfera griseoplana]|uniref:sulfite oxidase n=1 Tax=Peterkaempfera griseoplana TaxID=66896 RepID=UPI0006E448A9|nr:sulfite oxidase [Peterkaempfera griseoplana]